MNSKIMAIIVLITGVMMCAYFLFIWYRWYAVRKWESVPGKMLTSGFKQGSLAMWPARLVTYSPKVEYEYSFRGLKYIGSKISVRDRGLAFVDKNEAQKILDQLGFAPSVYVDPNDPASSYLINKIGWAQINYVLTYLVSGLLLSLIGIALLYI